ncbi:hypothetical protein RvY_10636 [Ramazzottius varieornatus]|uniref:Uncharacterized protein n=1 Tax=Ramazzottius varieornatus TaxID=947166 RepID=A0A1D1VFV6_RAMVA|nr:hypothetical protein RvY_10636 [Ramazzottius varieornatus]
MDGAGTFEHDNRPMDAAPDNFHAFQQTGMEQEEMSQETRERLITTTRKSSDSPRDAIVSAGSTSPEILPVSTSVESPTSGQFEPDNGNMRNVENVREGDEKMNAERNDFNESQDNPVRENKLEVEQHGTTESRIFPADWTPHPRMDHTPPPKEDNPNTESSVHLPGSPSVQMSEFEFTFAKSLFKDALSSTSATRFQSAVDVCKILALEYDSEEEEDEKIAPSIRELEQETADLAMQLFIKEAEESFLNAWAEGLTFEELSAYEQALSDEYRDLLDDTMEDIRAEMRCRFVAMEEELLPNIRNYQGNGDQLGRLLDDNVRSLQLYIKEQHQLRSLRGTPSREISDDFENRLNRILAQAHDSYDAFRSVLSSKSRSNRSPSRLTFSDASLPSTGTSRTRTDYTGSGTTATSGHTASRYTGSSLSQSDTSTSRSGRTGSYVTDQSGSGTTTGSGSYTTQGTRSTSTGLSDNYSSLSTFRSGISSNTSGTSSGISSEPSTVTSYESSTTTISTIPSSNTSGTNSSTSTGSSGSSSSGPSNQSSYLTDGTLNTSSYPSSATFSTSGSNTSALNYPSTTSYPTSGTNTFGSESTQSYSPSRTDQGSLSTMTSGSGDSLQSTIPSSSDASGYPSNVTSNTSRTTNESSRSTFVPEQSSYSESSYSLSRTGT